MARTCAGRWERGNAGTYKCGSAGTGVRGVGADVDGSVDADSCGNKDKQEYETKEVRKVRVGHFLTRLICIIGYLIIEYITKAIRNRIRHDVVADWRQALASVMRSTAALPVRMAETLLASVWLLLPRSVGETPVVRVIVPGRLT